MQKPSFESVILTNATLSYNGLMVQQNILFFVFLLLPLALWGQDERYYRQILSGELPQIIQGHREISVQQFNIQGPSYHIDLNDDGIEEVIIPQKRDGVDWIEIQDSQRRKIFEHKLLAMGSESFIYKLKLVSLSDKVKALIVFLDEGKTAGLKFQSTARSYFLTFENGNLSKLSFTEGPHHFFEKEGQREQYVRRDYQVNVRDINNDGTREILVEYGHIQRIFIYRGEGRWERF